MQAGTFSRVVRKYVGRFKAEVLTNLHKNGTQVVRARTERVRCPYASTEKSSS